MEQLQALTRRKTTRERKPLLRPISAATEALLGSLPCEVPTQRAELRVWTESLIAQVRTYSNAKGIKRGLFGAPLLSKAQADAALRAALAGGAAND